MDGSEAGTRDQVFIGVLAVNPKGSDRKMSVFSMGRTAYHKQSSAQAVLDFTAV